MPVRQACFAFALAGLSVTSVPAHAQGFLEQVARTVTAPITLPLETTIQVLRRDDPAEPLRRAAGDAGAVVTQSVDVAQRVHQQIANVPRDAVQRNLGGDWVHAYDTLTGSQRVQAEMGFTAGRFLGGCLQGQPCSVNQLVAMPLAASLRDSYKIYIGQSVPLDPNLIRVLSRVVPIQTLYNARIAFAATPDFTAPGFLNAGYTVFGQGHAVTIGNLMVFSQPLNLNNRSDWNWLLHELRHTEQYASHSGDVFESIDGFAVDYLQYSGSMENDAQSTADARQGQLDAICRFGC